MWVNVKVPDIKLVTKKVAALSRWFGRSYRLVKVVAKKVQTFSMWLQNGSTCHVVSRKLQTCQGV